MTRVIVLKSNEKFGLTSKSNEALAALALLTGLMHAKLATVGPAS